MTSTVSYKVILLGERGVGKTKLFKALREMETEVNTEGESCTDHASSGAVDREPSRSMISTVESQIDTCTKDVEIGGGGQVVRLQFCDTAGHTKVNSMMPQYYRNARLILLVYCCYDVKTLQSLDTWIETAKVQMDKADRTYSFGLVGLRSKQALELHPPLTYDNTEVSLDTLSNFLQHHYLSECLIFEVNLDTKEGFTKLLVTLGRAAKKLEKTSPGVKEVSTFTLSDSFDPDTFQIGRSQSTSVSGSKKKSASLKRSESNGDGCCSIM